MLNEETLKKYQTELEEGAKEQTDSEMRLQKRLLEVESLRYDIAILEQEKLQLSSQVYDIDSELLAEQKKRFAVEQEIDKFTRKGKQPPRTTGQRNYNAKPIRENEFTDGRNQGKGIVIPQDDP